MAAWGELWQEPGETQQPSPRAFSKSEGIGSQRIQGFPVQALPLQVPESPERSERLEVFDDSGTLIGGRVPESPERSERLEVFFDSGTLIGGRVWEGGEGCHLRGSPPRVSPP